LAICGYDTNVAIFMIPRPMRARRFPGQVIAFARRRNTFRIASLFPLGLVAIFAVVFIGCGGSGSPPTPPPPPPQSLRASDVQAIVQNAAQAADPATMVIAVVDRSGRVLAIFRKPSAPATAAGNFGASVDANDLAVAVARTAAFFSNDQAPLSSRTVRFISGIHFPPGVTNAPNAALYGIENTNRGCTLTSSYLPGQSFPPALSLSSSSGPGIVTGKADVNDSNPSAVNPGGVPLFKNGVAVGGVGVAGVSPGVAEFAAFSAAVSSGFGPTPAAPGVVVIDGVSLPFVNQTTRPAGVNAGSLTGAFLVGPLASQGPPPEGDLIAPSPGPLGGLSAADVKQILDNAEATANQTRAVIRLPIGSRARMVIAVADLDGALIGLRRMPDATVFSVDVAATKARNMVYFNSAARTAADLTSVPMGTAVTNRTIGFGAQPFYPPGIDGSPAGPFFNIFQQDVANPCTQGFQPAGPNQSGIVFFPGSVPLYRNGVLVGGLGVSGDGVDQDDFVTSGGSAGFEAPANIRADQVTVQGVRLPYLKFPRNPTD
jgi:uncharacterized protein GlcG (DUF336 family)